MASGPDLDLAAAFAFGRELLIPAMLRTIVSRIAAADADRWSPFQFYLERQIEIDEQEHGRSRDEFSRACCRRDIYQDDQDVR